MRLLLALAGTALLIVGCAQMEAIDDGLGFERRQSALLAIPDWDMRGGIAVDTGERAYQSRFRWHQRGNNLELEILGRVGVGRSRIAGNESRLTVEARGETQVLTDPERQLSEMLDWWLPVTSAEHWLLGRPDPDFPAESSNGSFGTLQSLGQRDWQIAYEDYQIAEGRLVPRSITMTHDSLELRIRVAAWESVTAEP